MKTNMAVGVK